MRPTAEIVHNERRVPALDGDNRVDASRFQLCHLTSARVHARTLHSPSGEAEAGERYEHAKRYQPSTRCPASYSGDKVIWKFTAVDTNVDATTRQREAAEVWRATRYDIGTRKDVS